MCIFCQLPPEAVIDENEMAFVVMDKFPKTPGHSLVITKRHLQDFFELTPEEMLAVQSLLNRQKVRLQQQYPGVTDFNIHTNIGKLAGQTVMHAHFHLLPRRPNDKLPGCGL